MPAAGLPPLSVVHREVDPWALRLGGRCGSTTYDWRPWHERLPGHREDYQRLFWALHAAGRMENPLIAYRGMVLIGMRRLEIARFLDWPLVPVAEIQEDISADPGPQRVRDLRGRLYTPVRY